MNLNGKLAKMVILSYAKDEKGNMKEPPVPFPVMYNPEKFSKELKVNYQCTQVPGDAVKEKKFHSTDEGTVSFQFLFDATGASINSMQGKAAKAMGTVDVQVELFHKLTARRDPKEHQNNYLTLVWGTFIYYCRLLSSKVEYTLFGPQGQPLRATIDATFVGVESRAKQAALDKLFSADLTHVYLVKAGETLHAISEKVYGDPRYYLQIARVNKLRNFRRLVPGMELILPPLDKREQ